MQCNDTGKVQRAQPPIANPQNAGLNAAGDLGDLMSEPYLQLHLEPSEHIEVSELTGALTALARQYNVCRSKSNRKEALRRALAGVERGTGQHRYFALSRLGGLPSRASDARAAFRQGGADRQVR